VDAKGEVTDAEGLGRLADCLAKRGQTTEAFAALRRAVALAPQNPRVSYNAIIVHLSSGNRDAAERWAAWAVQNGYNRNLLRRDPQLAGLPIRE
jgi:Flp pilus assembly protein TadD